MSQENGTPCSAMSVDMNEELVDYNPDDYLVVDLTEGMYEEEDTAPEVALQETMEGVTLESVHAQSPALAPAATPGLATSAGPPLPPATAQDTTAPALPAPALPAQVPQTSRWARESLMPYPASEASLPVAPPSSAGFSIIGAPVHATPTGPGATAATAIDMTSPVADFSTFWEEYTQAEVVDDYAIDQITRIGPIVACFGCGKNHVCNALLCAFLHWFMGQGGTRTSGPAGAWFWDGKAFAMGPGETAERAFIRHQYKMDGIWRVITPDSRKWRLQPACNMEVVREALAMARADQAAYMAFEAIAARLGYKILNLSAPAPPVRQIPQRSSRGAFGAFAGGRGPPY